MSLMSIRESLLTREIEDLKSKLMTKTDELNEAIKSNSEVCTGKYQLVMYLQPIRSCKTQYLHVLQ